MLNLHCKDVMEKASDWLDGNLPFWQRWPLRLHLTWCRMCAALVRDLETIKEQLRSLGTEPMQLSPQRRAAILNLLRDQRK